VPSSYKHLHGIYNVDSTVLFPLNQSAGVTTRGHCLKLQKRDCKTCVRANFLGLRIVNFWNNLPEYVVTADSVNVFKKAVAIFTASRKHSHVAIFTATVAVNIAMWLYLRQPAP